MTPLKNDLERIATTLKQHLPAVVDGRSAITEMRSNGSPNWRQMEWIGFWFEYFVDEVFLTDSVGLTGPRIGNTQFDMMLTEPWDLKVHPSGARQVILNDKTAVDSCIERFEAINFLLLSGDVEYDDERQTFKIWHDSQKGGVSRYEVMRVREGRPSRRRKISFAPTKLIGVRLDKPSLENAIRSRQIGYFQAGMRNSNGKARNEKYMMHLGKKVTDVETYEIEIDHF